MCGYVYAYAPHRTARMDMGMCMRTGMHMGFHMGMCVGMHVDMGMCMHIRMRKRARMDMRMRIRMDMFTHMRMCASAVQACGMAGTLCIVSLYGHARVISARRHLYVIYLWPWRYACWHAHRHG